MWIHIMGRYETRYRRKLNMLEPGTRMLKLSAILAAAAGLCALLNGRSPRGFWRRSLD